MLVYRRLAAVATLALVAFPAPQSFGHISKTIHLRAYVPVLCNVQLHPSAGMTSMDGIVNLGTTQEFCNAPRGYRLILQHPTDMADAAIISDTNRIPLSESGETVLANSDHPDFQMRHLSLDLGDESRQLSRVGLRIEVKY